MNARRSTKLFTIAYGTLFMSVTLANAQTGITAEATKTTERVAIAHLEIGETGTITGTIKTSDGKPAAFVSVGVKGTSKGAITAENGTYTIKNVKPGSHTLKVSFVGLQTIEKTVDVIANQTVQVDVVLSETAGKLDEVVISSTKSRNEKKTYAGKSGIAARDLPQSISVINNQVITDQQVQRLSDVVKNVNGVSLGTTRGTNAEVFFARGYNLGANNIFKNGARSNSGVIPEVSTLEQVEVLKGSAALLYGNVSGGAILNLVTKQPKFEYGGEVSMRYGSYNLYKPTADVYGPITKDLAFRLIGTYENAESYRDNVKSNRFYINPSLLYNIDKKTTLLVQADYLKGNMTPDFGIGTLTNTTPGSTSPSVIPTTIPRSAFFNTPWGYNKVDQTTASANLDHKFNDSWKLNVIGSYQGFNRNYYAAERIQADQNGDWNRVLTRSKTKEDYLTGQINLTGKFKTGPIEHQILVGTDAERYMNLTNNFNPIAAYDKINILDPSKYTVRTDIPETSIATHTETPTYRLGYYAQDLISLTSQFKVLAGLRWSYQNVTVAKLYDEATGNRIPNTMKDPVTGQMIPVSGKADKAFSPSFGLIYQPIKTTSIYASYANNFVPNSGTDIYGQNLKASLIDQYEVGVKNDLLDGKLSVNLSLYKIINSDLAIQAQTGADGKPNSISSFKEFSGQTTSDGIEIDVNGTILPGLNFMAGYSYNYFRYTKTPGGTGSFTVGERVVGSPAHTANATLFYTFSNSALKGLKVGASGFYTGKRNGGYNNTIGQAQKYDRLVPIGGFTTFDLSAGYTYKKISILGKLSNVSNALSYYVHENYSVNPIPPRQFITTLSYKF